ncbi:MAG: arsenate reductase (glutaredoxin) [Planctomycetes bacterium]|nr:arsenate reductase (glutaredoxin) [Planctomycetota bacterium]
MQPVLLHNPNCSKSRSAIEWLESKGLKFAVREYLQDPLSESELLDLAEKLDAPLCEWVRDAQALSEFEGLPQDEQNEALAQFVHEHPEAMQRPILICGDRARVGRPTEAFEEIL